MKTIAILLPLLITILSCAPNPDGKANTRSTQPSNDDGGDGNFKPAGDTPPMTNPAKLPVGTTFVWKYADNSGCFMWTLVENGNDKMSIHENRSANCKNFPEYPVRKFSWYVSNGTTIENLLFRSPTEYRELDDTPNILPMMVMGIDKAKYKINVMKINGVTYPVFSLDSNPSIIYARTDDALTGVVLKNTSKESKPFTFLNFLPAN